MGEALAVLIIIALFGFALWGFTDSWRNVGKPPPPLPRRTRLDDVVEGVGGCVSGLFGCLVALVLGLVALYVVVWLVKRMWEAA